jgi:peptidoglycan hydrolase CwlO-like protein
MGFDFSKYTGDIFKVKPKEDTIVQNNAGEQLEVPISLEKYGFRQAGAMNGSIEGLKICLHKVFQEQLGDMRRNETKQQELRQPFRKSLQDLTAINESLESQAKSMAAETIPAKQKRIAELKSEIAEIRKNPQDYSGNHVGKAGFYIGLIILALLTVYLFVFYSSASYSALFKNFSPDETVIAKAIFDAQAISNAVKDGLSELILILTIPAVFLGLGFLIHKFQETKGSSKYLKIMALLIITFIFDVIIAYEITEKIYEIKRGGSFDTIRPYSFKIAFQNISFWLVIFAGFIVYLIWGFVFDFVMESYSKLDYVKVHIKVKQEQIDTLEKEVNTLEVKIGEIKVAVEKNSTEMRNLRDTIDGTIVQPKEMSEALSQFMVGWHKWIANGKEYNRSDHNKIYEAFMATNINAISPAINPVLPSFNIN